jgi:hypothetical protein
MFSGVVLLDHMAVLFVVFKEPPSLLMSIVYKGPFAPAASPACVAVCFLNDSHSDWGERESQWCLICIFSRLKNVEHFFIYLPDFF